MKYARIYRPTKTAMQAGKARTRRWVLAWPSKTLQETEYLMRWNIAHDTQRYVSLSFVSRESGVFFAQKHNIPFIVEEDNLQATSLRPRSYADRLRYKKPPLFATSKKYR